VKISIAIVAHPDRYRMAQRLANHSPWDASSRVLFDDDGIGAKANHLRAWEWLSTQHVDWGIVLEDDVILCEDFQGNLIQFLLHSPSPVNSLYLGRGRPVQAQERIALAITQDISYITADALLSAQGYAMPVHYFSAKIQEQVSAVDLPIDESITHWVRSWHGKVAYPRYSLIDHRDGPTLIADHGDGQGRNGNTNLVVDGCDPSGSRLPEIRKAWLMAGHNTPWDLGSLPLPEGENYGAVATP
jgi:hypothetical protein